MEYKIFGDKPIGDTIIAAADSLYVLEHATALINSCKKYNNNIFI